MVYSFQICLLHAACGANPRRFIKGFGFGLDAGDEEKHFFGARDSSFIIILPADFWLLNSIALLPIPQYPDILDLKSFRPG